jgi:NAD(P)-dependent dehydrogenase (short-subunit alcohol dehydrogenase family)
MKEPVMPNTERRPRAPMPKQQQTAPGLESKMKPRPKYRAPEYRGAKKLEGKVALITGGDSGIGRAVAVLFARESAAGLALVYLPEEESDAQETRRVVEKEGAKCLLIPGDVQSRIFCESAIEQTVDKFGGLDVLVNNAAYQNECDDLESISDEQLERTFRTNIFGYFFMARAALKHLKRGGTIINTGSITGMRGSDHLIDYAATKGAIHAFTKALAQNLAEQGIRVNCVAPGPVWTPLIPATESPETVAKHGEKNPMKRPAQPEEIAPAFVFFAAESDSSFITGEVLTLLGGEMTTG